MQNRSRDLNAESCLLIRSKALRCNLRNRIDVSYILLKLLSTPWKLNYHFTHRCQHMLSNKKSIAILLIQKNKFQISLFTENANYIAWLLSVGSPVLLHPYKMNCFVLDHFQEGLFWIQNNVLPNRYKSPSILLLSTEWIFKLYWIAQHLSTS